MAILACGQAANRRSTRLLTAQAVAIGVEVVEIRPGHFVGDSRLRVVRAVATAPVAVVVGAVVVNEARRIPGSAVAASAAAAASASASTGLRAGAVEAEDRVQLDAVGGHARLPVDLVPEPHPGQGGCPL